MPRQPPAPSKPPSRCSRQSTGELRRRQQDYTAALASYRSEVSKVESMLDIAFIVKELQSLKVLVKGGSPTHSQQASVIEERLAADEKPGCLADGEEWPQQEGEIRKLPTKNSASLSPTRAPRLRPQLHSIFRKDSSVSPKHVYHSPLPIADDARVDCHPANEKLAVDLSHQSGQTHPKQSD